MSIMRLLKRVDDETTAANDFGPRPQDAVPIFQQVEAKRMQYERILQVRADTLAKLDMQAADAEIELAKACEIARRFTEEFIGDPIVEVHQETTVTLVTTPEQDQRYLKTEFEG